MILSHTPSESVSEDSIQFYFLCWPSKSAIKLHNYSIEASVFFDAIVYVRLLILFTFVFGISKSFCGGPYL